MTITKSGDIASFYTVGKAPIKHLKVYFSPKQAGTGDPSPSNVREISGWGGVEVRQNSHNFYDVNDDTLLYYGLGNKLFAFPEESSYFPQKQENGWTYTQTSSHGMSVLLGYFRIGDVFTASVSSKSGYFRFVCSNKVPTIKDSSGIVPLWIQGWSSNLTNTITTQYNGYYFIDFYQPNASARWFADLQVEFGSTATPYEPYRGETYSLDWSSTLGTLYGGYVDLITGELVQNYEMITINNTQKWQMKLIQNHSAAQLNLSALTENIKKAGTYGMFNYVKYMIDTSQLIDWNGRITNTGLMTIFIPNDINTRDDMNNYIAQHSLQICYELATPIVYQLSPTQLTTLIGQNNIWSNADRVEVEYDMMESNDELYRRRNTIIRSYPHIETTSGSIASFSTDLAAPLKECKIHFNPIQEGTGDPSPNNIREISGWNGVNCGLSRDRFIFIPSDTTIFPWTQNNVTLIYEGNGRYRFAGINETSSNIHFAFTISTRDYEGYGIIYLGSNKPAPTGVDRQIRLRRANETNMLNAYLNYDPDLNDYYISTLINSGPITEVRFTLRPGDGNYTFSPIFILHGEENPSSNIYVENILKTIPTHFSSTIYGGYIDLKNGSLISEYQYVCMKWKNIGAYKELSNCEYRRIGISTPWDGNTDNIYCNFTNNYSDNNELDEPHYSCKMTSDTVCMIRLFLPKDFDEEQEIQIAYKRKTPITYQLSLTQLKTLKNRNNIWSNTNGDISVKYWTH